MQKRITYLSMLYVLFIVLLFASGSLSGILSTAVYFLSFALPVAIGIYLTRRDGEGRTEYLTIEKDEVKKTIPLIAPTISIVIFTSYLTSLAIYYLTGRVNSVDLGDSFVPALISHALLPAILEEALFRYLPLRMLASRSKRGAIIISAFFFAFAHQDLFTIPYAFMAGVILMAIDIATDSVLPSIIIHFINNAISVGVIVFSDNPIFAPVMYSVLGILTVISIVLIVIKNREYRYMLSDAFEEGEKYRLTLDILCFACLMLIVACVKLF